MRLAAAGRAEQQQIAAVLEPGIAGGKRHEMRLAEHRHGGEIEGVEGLAGRQASLGKMALDAAAGALAYLQLGERGEQPRRRPALLVRACGDVGPHAADRRQAQLVEQHGQPGGVDFDAAHAAASTRSAPSSML